MHTTAAAIGFYTRAHINQSTQMTTQHGRAPPPRRAVTRIKVHTTK